mmetsp:Transcript_15068/g.45168  ORF Transcript_15068/g.45168 Transcript_15068/m.45168 type:complete len:456 (-) Transcript_15068:343-1710(-)
MYTNMAHTAMTTNSSPASPAAWSQGGGSFVIKNTFLHCTVEEDETYETYETYDRLSSRGLFRPLRPKSEPPRNRQPAHPSWADQTAQEQEEEELDMDLPELPAFAPQMTAPAPTTSTWNEWVTPTKDLAMADSKDEGTARGRHANRFNEQWRVCQDPMPWNTGVVTVMIRQVPRRYSQQQFLEKVVASGFEGLVTFVYLPVAMKKVVNVGYGFVSFTEPFHALRFRDMFDGGYLDGTAQQDDKALRIHPATVQGYQAACLYFSWKPKDMRCGPIFLGPNGHGIVEMTHQQAPPPAHLEDDAAGNRRASRGELSSKAKGAWASGHARGAQQQKQTNDSPKQRGQQCDRSGAVYVGINRPKTARNRGEEVRATRSDRNGDRKQGQDSPKHGAAQPGRNARPTSSAQGQGGLSYGQPQAWAGKPLLRAALGGAGSAQQQPSPLGKLDTWQAGSRALGA